MPLTPVTRRLAVGLLLALPAWLHAQPPSQPAPEPIRIALIEGLSGPAGLAGEAVWRNLLWATERVNARGGVPLPGGARPLRIERFDSKGQTEEALSALRSASDRGIAIVAQGNSSAAASALIDAIGKHNERQPAQRMLLLNYAAVDPALTNERCSFWHFRFDAHADMRLNALMGLIREDRALQSIYLIGQDYSFGQGVLRQARRLLEPRLVELFIANATDADIAALRTCIDDEEAARASGDMRRAIRLSGDFHLHIAQAAGHQTLGRILRELVSRTSLILMTYSDNHVQSKAEATSCGCQEHRALLDAIRLRDPREGARLMREHLALLEQQLQFKETVEDAPDLLSLFGGTGSTGT